ncbi:hypothetical protein [Streptococcus thoraltensis]|uniref:hypothetical protein n=1 Tax=Streptococcus thoraltensis TaxID=55085 RepID=UPI002A80FA7E|nr:hypothetical protein [Streptococcus thoraltensis]MDY4761431.1 hypothetical protein [Streptococcus thoraltensis]
MKRTLKLRGMQLLDHLKLTAMIMLGFGLIVTAFAALTFFVDDNSSFNMEKISWLNGSLQVISVFLSIWSFIVFFADGMLDFDSALRFGNKRKNYFIINFFVYAIMIVAATFLSLVSKSEHLPSWQTFSSEFWGNFAGCFIIAILGFAIYKWGWKVLFALFGIHFLSGIGLAIFSVVLRDNLPRILEVISQLPDIVYKGIGALALLAVISMYYWIIAKIEIK